MKTAAPAASNPATSDLERELLQRFAALSADRRDLLARSAEVARGLGSSLYWVGGGVRDLWLGADTVDIDLVVEGDVASFSERLADCLSATGVRASQFMTVELSTPEGLRFDLAAARTELYPHPASLPVVAPASIAEDLFRRDFSINCLALPLAPDFGGQIIDPCGGLADIADGRLRILHAGSFRDDPTRLFRLVEFAARFKFRVEEATASAAESAIAGGAVEQLSSARLGAALRRALERRELAGRILQELVRLDLLESVVPGLSEEDGAAACARFARALSATVDWTPGTDPFRLAMLALSLELDDDRRRRLARRVDLVATDLAVVVEGPARIREAMARLQARPSASQAHLALRDLFVEELAVMASDSADTARWALQELTEMRPLRLSIGGRDLLAAGLLPGPEVGRALERTLRARIDGRIPAAGELEFALRAADGLDPDFSRREPE
ncbi:MAG: hypothetical protein ABI639_11975 [Thermoanaerobaculia bacterium]